MTGDFDGAVGKWEEVQEGPHRPSRAKAAVARTELLLKLQQIDDFEAIIELEKLPRPRSRSPSAEMLACFYEQGSIAV